MSREQTSWRRPRLNWEWETLYYDQQLDRAAELAPFIPINAYDALVEGLRFPFSKRTTI